MGRWEEERGLAAVVMAGRCRRLKYARCALHGPCSVGSYQCRPPLVVVSAANVTADSIRDTLGRHATTAASVAMSRGILHICKASSSLDEIRKTRQRRCKFWRPAYGCACRAGALGTGQKFRGEDVVPKNGSASGGRRIVRSK